jgi:hypothetical protein
MTQKAFDPKKIHAAWEWQAEVEKLQAAIEEAVALAGRARGNVLADSVRLALEAAVR